MRKKILFVNDSATTQNMREMLDQMVEFWEMQFVQDETSIWGRLESQDYDVIVLNLRTPEVNGIELFERVKEHYPQLVRVMIAGPSDQEIVLRAIRFNHHIIAEPFNPHSLMSLINRSCQLRDILRDEKLKQSIARISNLPSLPSLYQQIISELQSPRVSVKRVADLIAQDVTMTAKILQLVNSAFFSLPQKIINPHQAVVLLGIDIIKGLVLHVHIFSSFKVDSQIKNFSIEALSKHSLLVAKLAREIVLAETSVRSMEDDALVAGLLHDIGKLALLRDPDRYNQVMAHCQSRKCNHYQGEYEVLGASHAEMGAYLLDLWGIPEPVVQAIAFHHNPSKAMETNFSVLTAVHAANVLINRKKHDGDQYPGLDLFYLLSIRKKEEISKWEEIHRRFKENRDIQLVSGK
ncbi:MAG: HDOD domain-containing protein [Firmicutes bacterium]|nr:HDOD domain-containing protein [Bacillota bacterium]